MNVLIMGCGRVGARIATTLDAAGHDVTIMDLSASAFRRLPATFRGTRVVGNGMDMPALEKAGIERMEAFVAVTQGDNRNYFASQLAREVFGIQRVICRIYDPMREELFHTLGIETFSPTRLGAQIMVDMVLGASAPTKETA